MFFYHITMFDLNELSTVIGGFIVVIAARFLWLGWRESTKLSVPWAKLSMVDTIGVLTSFDAPMRLHALSLNSGTVFRLCLPQIPPFVVCTEWEVAKDIFNEKSSDKPDQYKVFEVGTGCPVLVSKKTSSEGPSSWAKERKVGDLLVHQFCRIVLHLN